MDEDVARNRLFRRFCQLSLAIVGESIDHQVIQPMGSAFFIAPYIAVTAKHVVKALWDELRAPWERGRYPRKAVDRAYYAILGQIPDPDRPDELARWQATGAPSNAFGDIAFLTLVPANDVAEKLTWPHFPDLELIAPDVGQSVAAYGFPEVALQKIDEGTTKVSATSKLATGVVTNIYEEGRASWRFPQFETSAEFAHGMSGGPVFHEDKVCGVVSYAGSYDGEIGPSYAAALWPALLADPVKSAVDPRESIQLVSLLTTGAVRAPGWRSVLRHVAVVEDKDGTRTAVRRITAG